jgi:hypothetical protein
LRLDQPEPVTGGESLPQELRALDPGKNSEVIAGELEQIEGNEVKLPRRGGVALKSGSAYGCEVLNGSAVLGAERDELSIEARPPGCLSERCEQRAEAIT